MVSFNRLAFLSFQSTISKRSVTSYTSPSLSARQGGNKLGLPIAFLTSIGLSVGTAVVAAPGSHSILSSNSDRRGNSSTRCMASSSSIETTMSNNADIDTGYLNAKDAYDLDQHLFANGYTLEQLMELAGLAVAEAVYQAVPIQSNSDSPLQKILIVCGPGNNGGDGLVAARHLSLFGYEVTVLYPKRSKREEQKHYDKLVTQCLDVGVTFVDIMPSRTATLPADFDAVVDAIFGFSFKGEPREPFASILRTMTDLQSHSDSNTQIISVDVPSGWNVDDGPPSDSVKLVPDVLVSLTAPKLCAKEFHGRHFVGGRFLPPNVAQKYGIRMPPYPGVAQVMEISKGIDTKGSTTIQSGKEDQVKDNQAVSSSSTEGWEAAYAEYCAEKDRELAEKDAAAAMAKRQEVDGDNAAGAEDWAVQYHNYCVEKEAQLGEEDKARRLAKEKGEK